LQPRARAQDNLRALGTAGERYTKRGRRVARVVIEDRGIGMSKATCKRKLDVGIKEGSGLTGAALASVERDANRDVDFAYATKLAPDDGARAVYQTCWR
jgi:hypothetical protein